MRILFFLAFFAPVLIHGQGDATTWHAYSFGTPALRLSLPGKPAAQSATLPPAAMAFIQTYEASYINNPGKGYIVTMMHLTYTSDVTADGYGAIEGTNGQWEKVGNKVAILHTSETKVSGKKAILQRGKLIKGGEEHEYVDVVVLEHNKLWQVIVMVKAGNASLKTMMQKITDSMAF